MRRITRASTGEAGFSRTGLARHLRIDLSTLDSVTTACGLRLMGARYPLPRVLRCIHRTEISSLPKHLAEFQTVHPSSGILSNTSDLVEELARPLLTFAELAVAFGVRPNTLSRSLREGRQFLPFAELQMGSRLRRYRPFEVELWRDEEIRLRLPAASHAAAHAPPSRPGEPDPAANPPNSLASGKALFAPFVRSG